MDLSNEKVNITPTYIPDFYYSIYRKYHKVISNWEEENIKPYNDTIQVVGITIPNRKTFVNALEIGEELVMVRDVNNEYDINAIMVMNQQENQIGFVAKDCASIFASKMDIGFKYKICVKAKEPKVIQCNVKLTNKEDVILPEIFKGSVTTYC